MALIRNSSFLMGPAIPCTKLSRREAALPAANGVIVIMENFDDVIDKIESRLGEIVKLVLVDCEVMCVIEKGKITGVFENSPIILGLERLEPLPVALYTGTVVLFARLYPVAALVSTQLSPLENGSAARRHRCCSTVPRLG